MAKDLRYYFDLSYPIVISEGIDNGKLYIEAEIPELPGCGSFGETVEEALSRLREARELWIKARFKRGLEIPEPISEDDYSGKFLLRLTPALHRKLAERAKTKDVSLNQFVRNALEETISIGTVLEKLRDLEQKINIISKVIEKPATPTVSDSWTGASPIQPRGVFTMFNSLGSAMSPAFYIADVETGRKVTAMSDLMPREE